MNLTFIGKEFVVKMGKNRFGRRFTPKGRFDRNKRKEQNMEETVKNNSTEEQPDAVIVDDINATPAEDQVAEATVAEGADEAVDEVAKLKEEIAKEKKEYLFLMAEFDNFRKRTLKEKSELIKNAAESAFKGLLPIVDDFERALKATENTEDVGSVREGMELIYKKLKKYMEQNGVKEMDPEDREFNADRHEAISAVPVPDESQKGKILDTVEKGYTINDKVLRHAKVVVGQ